MAVNLKISERPGLFATGGLIGALLAASCCIAPFALLMLGVSGAWIGTLTALAPYQPIFLLLTFGFLGAGFWNVYNRPKAHCEAGSYCASATSTRVLKTTLWVSAVLVTTAIGVNVLLPLFI